MRRVAVFPVASSVVVARSPRVGVPSIPPVVSGGWWVCAGVIRTASDSCFGVVGGVCPRESCGIRWGWGGAGPSAVVCPSWVWVVAPAMVSSSSVPRSPLLPLPCPWVVSCPHVVSLSVPCPYGRVLITGGPSVPPCLSVPCRFLPSPCPWPSPSRCGGGGVGGGGADGPGLGVGGLEPLAEGLGDVGGAKALDRVAEEGPACRLRHDGLRGGLIGVGGGAGAHLLEGVHQVHPFSPSRSPGPLHPAAELLQRGGRRPGEVGGGPWGVWFGLGQGLCRTPWPTVSTRLCADTTGLGESRLSGPKACRTVDHPRTPWWHTREGDAAVPVCVARAGQEGGACMLVALAGHDGSHGCAAPGPARWRRCRSSVSGSPRCGLVRPCRRL